MPRPQSDDGYDREYRKGWRYGRRSTATLDHLDKIGASEGMYDGYLDHAAGRPKGHTPRQKGAEE